jgi:hypothetical protein
MRFYLAQSFWGPGLALAAYLLCGVRQNSRSRHRPRDALKEGPNPTKRRGADRDEIQNIESWSSHHLFQLGLIFLRSFGCLCLKDCLAQSQ